MCSKMALTNSNELKQNILSDVDDAFKWIFEKSDCIQFEVKLYIIIIGRIIVLLFPVVIFNKHDYTLSFKH